MKESKRRFFNCKGLADNFFGDFQGAEKNNGTGNCHLLFGSLFHCKLFFQCFTIIHAQRF
jgi:hypothetical protein